MPFSKRLLPSLHCWLLTVALLWLTQGVGWAAEATTDASEAFTTPSLTLERSDGNLLLTARFRLALPTVVEDALQKGIPIYFLARAELLRERWYWTKRSVTTAQRRTRLAYHPLTRRWRLTTGSGDMTEATQGLTLGQNFESLDDAMAAVRGISRWKIAEDTNIESGVKHLVTFSFELDTSQLPRPLQIGTLGQSDWALDVNLSQPLEPERSK
ncbi:DUF4390 domain-containing protein [Rhodoferax antarcticus]|nr:DUF4390 domain-containing protein [Rhodoferax antarcticus]APW45522.1 hypothetical protein RA876_03055 [Rhodoferax antarcticus]MCW2314306.1 hypothetical protein [Rhodoferax antarcticus]